MLLNQEHQLTQKLVRKLPVPPSREASCQHVIVQKELKETVGAQISVVFRNAAFKLVVFHVEVTQTGQDEILWQILRDFIVAQIKVKHVVVPDAVWQSACELVVTQNQVTYGMQHDVFRRVRKRSMID